MKKLAWLLFVLTVANGLLFAFRDRFQYVSYSTYAELYGECNTTCLAKWDDFKQAYTEADWQAARQLLAPLQLDSGSTLSKLKRISRHLYGRFHGQAGFPKDIIHHAPPLQAYHILSADTSQKLFCGTYAMMVSFFCWSQNIVCRNVEIFRPGDHHVLNEVYLPEQKQWMLVDLTNNVLMATKGARLLNTRDLAVTLAAPQDLRIVPASDTAAVSLAAFPPKESLLHYYGLQFPYYYYHATQQSTIYRAADKIKRYFLPQGWYEVYSDNSKAQPLFYARLFLALAWLILGGMIVFKLRGND